MRRGKKKLWPDTDRLFHRQGIYLVLMKRWVDNINAQFSARSTNGKAQIGSFSPGSCIIDLDAYMRKMPYPVIGEAGRTEKYIIGQLNTAGWNEALIIERV